MLVSEALTSLDEQGVSHEHDRSLFPGYLRILLQEFICPCSLSELLGTPWFVWIADRLQVSGGSIVVDGSVW